MGILIKIGNIPSPIVVNPPTGLATGSITGNSIQLSWDASSNGNSYVLQRATNAGFTANVVTAYSGALLTFNNTGLSANTQYYYRVKATLGGYESAYSATVNATTVLLLDTSLSFSASDEQSNSGVWAKAAATSANTKLEFNKVVDRIGTPCNMDVNVGGSLFMIVTFPSDYVGQTFALTDSSNNVHIGVLTNGTVNF